MTPKRKGWSVFKFISKLIALGDVDHAQVVAEKADKREGDKKSTPLHTKRKPDHRTIAEGGYLNKDN